MSVDWKQVVEQSRCGIAIGSADGSVIEDMNPAFAHMHGYSVAELAGAPLHKILAPQMHGDMARYIELADGIGHYHFQSWHLHRDGHTFPLLIDIATVKKAGGSVQYRIINTRDIPPQAEFRNILQWLPETPPAGERLLRGLFENMPIPVVICEPDGRFVSVNRAMCEMLGYSEEELLAKTLMDISHPDDLARNLARREQLLRQERQGFAMEKRYLRKDGEVIWAHMLVSLITDSDGRPQYTIGQMIDINREKLMEQQLATARRQRDTLVREVHHRIKNNLQSVTGLLLRQKLAHPGVGAMLSGAIQQVETIAIVHGLQSGAQRGHLRLCDMLAEIVAAANALNADTQPVVLYNELQTPLLIADDETVPLALVLNELVINAIKHSDSRRGVAVTVTMLRLDVDSAMVTISNPGSAFSPAFDFENGGGVGMGLKLVRSLLPPSGGCIRYSYDDAATTVQLRLSPPVVYTGEIDTFL